MALVLDFPLDGVLLRTLVNHRRMPTEAQEVNATLVILPLSVRRDEARFHTDLF